MAPDPIEPLPESTLEERREKLKSLLRSMSSEYFISEADMASASETLSNIYSDGYRQMYSEIFPMIIEINDDSDCDDSMEFLTYNMEVVRRYIGDHMDRYPEYLYGKVLKLSDHVNLEVQRYQDSEELRRDLGNLYEDNRELDRMIINARNKLSRFQTETVVILGIFSAIVMTFSGGITFLGTSLEGMVTTNPFKLAFVILLCGIVIFNTIAYLFHYIGKVVYDLYSDDVSRSYAKFWKFNIAYKTEPRFSWWFVLLFDSLLISMLIIDLYYWVNSGVPMT